MAQKDEDTGSEVTLADFVVKAKADAFVENYTPLTKWQEGCEVFNDSKLRSFFKAVPCSLGDPLNEYLSILAANGFRMRVDESGEPVIYAFCKF